MPTPTAYSFEQEVDFTSVLQTSIQSSSIAVSLASISTVGSGPTMEVSVNFNDVLSSADQTTLNALMAAYVNTAPPPTVPSVVQVLGADTLTLCPFGAIIQPTANAVTSCDIVLPTTMVLRGAQLFSSNAVVGDWFSLQVIDKDNVTGQGGTPDSPTILGTYLISWYVMPGVVNAVEDVSISQQLPQGVYIRVVYTSVGTTAPSVLINFISYTGTP
jgi:hypothetical protein